MKHCTACKIELPYVIVTVDRKPYCMDCGLPRLLELEKLEDKRMNKENQEQILLWIEKIQEKCKELQSKRIYDTELKDETNKIYDYASNIEMLIGEE